MGRFADFLGWSNEFDIPVVTAWLLSKENLSRPPNELDSYFEVLIELFGRLPELCEDYDMAIKFIGSLDLLPDHLLRSKSASPSPGRT